MSRGNLRLLKPIVLVSLLFSLLLFPFELIKAMPAAQTGVEETAPLAPNEVERGHALAYSPDGETLAVGISAGIILYDVRPLARRQFIETPNWARGLAFSPDGNLLAAGLFDHTIRVYEMPAGRLALTLVGHTGWVRQVAITPDGSALVSVSDDDTLRVWNLADGRQTDLLLEGLVEPRSFALSPNGELLAVGMQDGSLSLFQFKGLKFLRRLTGHSDWVRCLAFSPDGSLLASGAFDRKILLWNPVDGSLLKILEGHTSSVLDLAFSPDGELLASGSVDQTVRLWRLPEGSPLSTLVGHQDFVYAVEFSPDGRWIASAGEDNALRMWDTLESIHESAQTGVYPPTSQPTAIESDCRSCHHPLGESAPPRVVEVRCDTCHTRGAGLNFCPIFPLSPEAEEAGFGYRGDLENAGVPVDAPDLAVRIASPANGEGLFTKGLYIAPATVAGRVYSSKGGLEGGFVRLEAWTEGQLATDLTVPLSENGVFKIRLTYNSAGGEPISGKGGDHFCNICHEDFNPQGTLPEGQVRLRVTAITSDGRQAYDERWFTVDATGDAEARVHVRDAESGLPLEGAPVFATALQYNWRSRYFRGSAGADGTLNMTLETLSENPTTYRFSVPETVVNGVLFTGLEEVEVTVPAGSRSFPDVNLSARALKGELSGRAVSPTGDPLSAVAIWAVKLPIGLAASTRTDPAGRFAFADLTLTRYRLIARTADGASTAADLDLINQPSSEADLTLSQSPVPALRARDADGAALPFFWLVDEETGRAVESDPLSGVAFADDLKPGSNLRVAGAPGYYSRLVRLDANRLESPLELGLKRAADLQRLPWGKGQVFLPAESRLEMVGRRIELRRGWIWGEGDGPLEIHYKDSLITTRGGRFAIEARPEGESWLYVYTETAAVQFGGSHPVQVRGGQLIALTEGAEPISMNEEWAAALRLPTDAPREIVFEPGLSARVRDGLARLGVGAAKSVTLTAYLLMLVFIAALPLLGIYWYLRRRAASRKESHLLEDE